MLRKWALVGVGKPLFKCCIIITIIAPSILLGRRPFTSANKEFVVIIFYIFLVFDIFPVHACQFNDMSIPLCLIFGFMYINIRGGC